MNAQPEQLPAITEAKQITTTVPLTPEGLPVQGCHENVIDTDYRRAPGINKSSLDRISRSPATYDFERRHPKPGTPAMFFGSAFHCLVLEPVRFAEEYVQDPYAGSQSKEAKLGRMELAAQGKQTINTKGDPLDPWDASDWDKLHRMRDAVMKRPVASALIEDAIKEMSFWWIDEETKKLCKGRVDGWCVGHNIAIDLKTSSDATYSGFLRSIHDYRYHVQDSFYSDGLRACGKMIGEFIFIVVEKEPPYLCAEYMAPFDWRQQGRVQYAHDLAIYKQCREDDVWPGLPDLRELQMPNFARFGRIS